MWWTAPAPRNAFTWLRRSCLLPTTFVGRIAPRLHDDDAGGSRWVPRAALD
jgi:hypothetical protein